MKVIVFSTNGLDPYCSLGFLNEEMLRDCEYITTDEKLRESLGGCAYDLIIIDSKDFAGLEAATREQIGGMENLSVLLLRSPGRKADGGAVLPRKLVLHKGEEKFSPQSSHDRDIIRATAATLGHEINNPLMSIYASAEMILKESTGLSSGAIEKIKRISDEVSRIKKSTDLLIDVDRVLLKMTPAGNMIDITRRISDKDVGKPGGEDDANKNLDIELS